jgi:cell division protein FtsQ
MTGMRVALPWRGRNSAPPREPAVRRLPRLRRRAVAAAMAALALLAAGGLWLRDSPLVAIEHVQVKGADGPDGPAIRRALTAAAREMTTLHVRQASLRDAVASYPVVKRLEVRTHPLHGLSIRVVELAPAAALIAGDRRVAVAADGTILRHARLDPLPLVPARVLPGGDRLRDRQALGAVAVASAAPATLRAVTTRIRSGGRDGLRADLQGGVRIVFGSRERLGAKWAAAARVLADPKAAGAAYVDVRVPERPVAGPFTDSVIHGQPAQAGADAGQSGQPASAPGADAGAAARAASGAPPGTDAAAATSPTDAQANP